MEASGAEQSPGPNVTEEDHDGEEQRPLLAGAKDGDPEKKNGDIQWSSWRRWVVLCALWLAQVFMTSAYSLIAPFFPLEV